MKKEIIYVRDSQRPRGRTTGAGTPTWNTNDNAEDARIVNAMRRESAEKNRKVEAQKSERFRAPRNLPIIREKKSWWPF